MDYKKVDPEEVWAKVKGTIVPVEFHGEFVKSLNMPWAIWHNSQLGLTGAKGWKIGPFCMPGANGYDSEMGFPVFVGPPEVCAIRWMKLLLGIQKPVKLVYPERRKMTPKLRYSILERDNFTCKACGRHSGPTVQLHVDHIVPVSKGGLTESDNLQTLCQVCNAGKRDG
jgi:hypothetical protein